MSERYARLFDLTGKTVLVAGGAGAIGAEMARAAAAYGARVAITGRTAARCEPAVAQITADGGQALGVAMDVREGDSITAAVEQVVAQLGPLDGLINAAGTHIEQPAVEMTAEAWDEVVDTNLRGAFLLSQAAARAMIAAGRPGSIIHVTSVRSNLGIRRGYAAYVASKGGLAILIKQLATEWAPHGIRVNGIAPTFTRTPLVEAYLNDAAFYQALIQRIPMGRVCETGDLAGLAIFLLSDASSFITGQNVFVDGGVTATQ